MNTIRKLYNGVRADENEYLRADFQLLIQLLRLPSQEDPIKMMHTWFATESDWLLIFDNADDLQIVEEIFIRGVLVLGPELQSIATEQTALDTATATLRKYSLLNREVKGDDDIDRFSIHRVRQEIIIDEMDTATQQEWAERAVRAVPLALSSI